MLIFDDVGYSLAKKELDAYFKRGLENLTDSESYRLNILIDEIWLYEERQEVYRSLRKDAGFQDSSMDLAWKYIAALGLDP